MKSLMSTFLIVLVALMTAGGQAAPIRGHNCTPDNSTTSPDNSTDVLSNSTTVNATATSNNITVLQITAAREIYGVFQEIRELENYTGEYYNLSTHDCYVRFEPTNNVDIKFLKDDVKYLNELTTVIKDIAKNETDEIIINYYEEIIYSMENGIVALINFIAALENNATADNVNKEEEKEEGFTLDTQDSSNTTKTTPTDGKPTDTKPTEAEPTDSPVKDKMDTGSKDTSETDHCMQLDKEVKLSALKLQVILTWQDILYIKTM